MAIVGMGRSGTSFLAAFLAGSGVYFGERPGKKLEHPVARQINESILAERFGARTGLPYGRLPQAEITVDETWRPKVVGFVEDMDRSAEDHSASGYWAFKDPRTTVLHSLWIDQVDVVLGVFRNPTDVVASYLAAGWIHGPRKRATALRYWIRFNQSLLATHARCVSEKPMYLVDFDADVPEQLAKLCEHLGLRTDEKAFSLYDKRPGRKLRFGGTSREARQIQDELRSARNLI